MRHQPDEIVWGGDVTLPRGEIDTDEWSANKATVRTLSRRTALQLLGPGIGVALLAACGPAQQPPASTSTAPPAPTATSAPAPAAAQPTVAPTSLPPTSNPATSAPRPTSVPASAAQPKSGGTLRYGLIGDLSALDSYVQSPVGLQTTWQAFDRLTQYDANLKPKPMLAESWDINSDYTQIKLNLRKGVQFHSGREFTSDDVKYSIQRLLDPKVVYNKNWKNWFTAVDTPDKYAVVLQSDTPRPSVFDFFEFLNIQDKDTLEGPDAKTKLIGTGPFSFVEWVQGDHLTFAKNANYWQTGRPYLDGFKATIIKDPVATQLQIEAGALDLARLTPSNNTQRLKSDPNYQIITHPYSGSFLEFGFTTKPPLDNKLVRQALNYAINRQYFADTTVLGYATPGALPWATTSPAYDLAKNNSYAFDLEKAQSLLNQAGATSLTLDFDTAASAYPQLADFAQVYQADLAKIGVQLNVPSMDLATWIDVVVNQHNYSIYAANDIYTNLSPSTLLNGPSLGPTNHSDYKSDRWTQLLAAVGMETDPAKLNQLYSDVNDLILDESWCVAISNDPILMIGRSIVKDVNPTSHGGGFSFTDTWLSS
jgi:peptide/nickel transport system substrate-binding protein